MNAAHSPAPGGPFDAGDDASRWREAAQLRRDYRGWTIVWLAPTGEFHAYKRLPGTRRDTALVAVTASELSDQIGWAEQAARTPASTKETSDE